MNKRNILKVAKAIEDAAKNRRGFRGVGFNMAEWGGEADDIVKDLVDECGTVACLAGWAYLHRYPSVTAKRLSRVGDRDDGRIFEAAQEFFDLSEECAEKLFEPSGCWLVDIGPMHAVAVLRKLARTGKVDWTVRP